MTLPLRVAAGQVILGLNDSNKPRSPETNCLFWLSNDRVIFKEVFQTERRELRAGFEGSSGLESPKLEHADMHHQSSDERLPLPDASVPPFVRGIVQSIENDQKVLEEDLSQCRFGMKLLEENMKLLNLQQFITEAEICELQAGLDYDYSHDRECTFEKEFVMEQIASKRGSAAAVICSIFQAMGKEHMEQGDDFANNILGVVACLGIVQSNDLSRILAKYLNEDQMLAIVCKSSAYVSNLIKYEPDGRVNSSYGLHGLAAALGLPIDREYIVICLDNLRVYTGEICSDSQRKLALPDPTLSNGKRPPGYLGFAVNLIDPGVGCWECKTSSGHGLRETLFYQLFGELQVYETREDMEKASYCITKGAVSLDGGIVSNGLFTVGCWEPDIKFPVICSETRRHFSARSVGIMKQVDEKKQKIRETVARLKREEEKHTQVTKKFSKMNDKYMKFLHKKGPLLKGFYSRNGTSMGANSRFVNTFSVASQKGPLLKDFYSGIGTSMGANNAAG